MSAALEEVLSIQRNKLEALNASLAYAKKMGLDSEAYRLEVKIEDQKILIAQLESLT